MSDIIERMEAWIRPAGTNIDLPLYREAIDEIKRLRAIADAAAELIAEAERTQIGFVALSKLRVALENARKE